LDSNANVNDSLVVHDGDHSDGEEGSSIDDRHTIGQDIADMSTYFAQLPRAQVLQFKKAIRSAATGKTVSFRESTPLQGGPPSQPPPHTQQVGSSSHEPFSQEPHSSVNGPASQPLNYPPSNQPFVIYPPTSSNPQGLAHPYGRGTP